jgi:prepilin-type N-terminal cleavage/methylation domain-containing protein
MSQDKERLGFTLVELLVVIAIVAILMALSAAAWFRSSRQIKAEGAAENLTVMLRQARTTAVRTTMPVRIEFSGDGRRVSAWRFRMQGEWNFNNRTAAGIPVNGVIRGAKIVPGAIGWGLELGNGSSSGYVEIDEPELFNMEDGGFIEARINFYSLFDEGYVLRKGHSYHLSVKNGRLYAAVGGVTLKNEEWILTPRRWTKVALQWDRASSRLFVDDAPIATGPGMFSRPSDEALLLGSDDGASLIGLIDEVRVAAASLADEVTFPERIEVTPSVSEIFFHAGTGRLDLRRHSVPVEIKLQEGQKLRRIHVFLLGQTQRDEVENVSQTD